MEKYKIIEDIVIEKKNNKFAIVFNYKEGETYLVNKTGLYIFNLLFKKKSLKDILFFFKKKFPNIDSKLLENDIKIFLLFLYKKNLVSID